MTTSTCRALPGRPPCGRCASATIGRYRFARACPVAMQADPSSQSSRSSCTSPCHARRTFLLPKMAQGSSLLSAASTSNRGPTASLRASWWGLQRGDRSPKRPRDEQWLCCCSNGQIRVLLFKETHFQHSCTSLQLQLKVIFGDNTFHCESLDHKLLSLAFKFNQKSDNRP